MSTGGNFLYAFNSGQALIPVIISIAAWTHSSLFFLLSLYTLVNILEATRIIPYKFFTLYLRLFKSEIKRKIL